MHAAELRLLMSLSSLSSDNFSEHADRETLFKDVQSSRKVSFPILMISLSFLISNLAFLETEHAAKYKGLTPFLCIHPFASLTSCAACLLAADTSVLTLLPLSKNRWKVRTCNTAKEKKHSQKKKTLEGLVSHPFTTLGFIFRKVIPVSI